MHDFSIKASFNLHVNVKGFWQGIDKLRKEKGVAERSKLKKSGDTTWILMVIPLQGKGFKILTFYSGFTFTSWYDMDMLGSEFKKTCLWYTLLWGIKPYLLSLTLLGSDFGLIDCGGSLSKWPFTASVMS